MVTRGLSNHGRADDAPRRLYRSREDRVLAGVAGGLGHYLRVDALWVRLAFVIAAFAGGVGLIAYAVCWLVIRPAEPGEELTRHAQPQRGKLEIAAGALILFGVLFVLRALGFWLGDGLVWPGLLVVVGLVLLWRRSTPERRQELMAELEDLRARRLSPTVAELLGRGADSARWGRPELRTLTRLAFGLAFLIAGAAAFAAANETFRAARDGVIAMFIVLVGLALIFGPWAWRLARELAAERRERVRSQERAEVAAHLHDSVLQTLALIQRDGNDSETMVKLARRQERELRAWLYGDNGPSDEASLANALQKTAAEIEDLHGVAVEVITVGDCALDSDLEAMFQAAREAIVNAARLSGDSTVAVYLEIEPERVTCFVRDRGSGFDLDAVPADRKGVSESIVGRMQRHGGSAVVRTSPGAGTEVELSLRRAELADATD